MKKQVVKFYSEKINQTAYVSYDFKRHGIVTKFFPANKEYFILSKKSTIDDLLKLVDEFFIDICWHGTNI